MIEEIIQECSGLYGLTLYRECSLEYFLEWFERDIQYNTPESKALGEKLIKDIRNGEIRIV